MMYGIIKVINPNYFMSWKDFMKTNVGRSKKNDEKTCRLTWAKNYTQKVGLRSPLIHFYRLNLPVPCIPHFVPSSVYIFLGSPNLIYFQTSANIRQRWMTRSKSTLFSLKMNCYSPIIYCSISSFCVFQCSKLMIFTCLLLLHV